MLWSLDRAGRPNSSAQPALYVPRDVPAERLAGGGVQRQRIVLLCIVDMPVKRSTSDAGLPGAFAGETVTRRRLMTGVAHGAGAIAAAAAALPALGFALGPVFKRLPTTWQPLGALADIPRDTYAMRVVTETPGIR